MPDSNQKIQEIDRLIAEAREICRNQPDEAIDLLNKANMMAKNISYPKGQAAIARHLGECYKRLSNFRQALNWFTISLDIIQKHHFDDIKPPVITSIGITHARLGNYPKALKFFKENLDFATRRGISELEVESLVNLANIHTYHLNNYEKALEYLSTAQRKHPIDGDILTKGLIINNLAILYKHLSNYDKAITLFLESEQLYKQAESAFHQRNCYNNLGLTYSEMDNLEKSEYYHQKSLDMSRQLNDENGIATSSNNLAVVYQKKGELEKAAFYCQQAIEGFRSMGSKFNLVFSLIQLGKIYTAQERFDDALSVLENSLKSAEENSSKKQIYLAHHGLWQAYKKSGDYKKALSHYEIFHDLKEEVFHEASDKRIRQLQITMEMERKEQELELYRLKIQQQEKELASLARNLAEKNELIHQLKKQEEPITSDKMVQYLENTQGKIQTWLEFKKEFNRIHPTFLPRLTEKYPALTRQELKVCALTKIGLTAKEIANLLFISKRSVDTHRHRVRKKLNLSSDQSLPLFLSSM
jgi:tetratricopeptide (TPR) repeat protein